MQQVELHSVQSSNSCVRDGALFFFVNSIKLYSDAVAMIIKLQWQ